jgi:hypothetical protein
MPNPSLDEQLKAALVEVAAYFDDQAKFFENHKSPYQLQQSSRSEGSGVDDANLMRGRARALAGATLSLFKSPLYGTLATVMTVGLALNTALTGHQIEKWVK